MRGKSASDCSESEVRDIAIGYLGRREYGVEELRQKLQQRGADAGITHSVIEALVKDNLLSDQRFTQMYIRTRVRALFGPLKIRGELRQRGISDAVITREMPDEQNLWFDSACEWVNKRHHAELDYTARAKLHRSLMNRGFTHEQASVALDQLVH